MLLAVVLVVVWLLGEMMLFALRRSLREKGRDVLRDQYYRHRP